VNGNWLPWILGGLAVYILWRIIRPLVKIALTIAVILLIIGVAHAAGIW
jgi:hypothetical protein